MADNYPFDSDNVPYSAVFNQDYTADSAKAVSAEVAQITAISLITIEGGAGGTSAGVGGTGGSVTLLDSAYSTSRDKYSGGDGGTASGSNGAGGGGAAGYTGIGGDAGSAAAANSGGGGGGGASINNLLLGGGGVGLFGKGTTGSAGTTSAAAGGGSRAGSDSAEGGFDGFFDSALAQPNYILSSSSSAPTGLSSGDAATSAAQLLSDYPNASSGFYYININSTPTLVYCDMENDGGGWMLVAKANGVDDSYWKYSDAIWTNSTLLNTTSNPLTTDVHIKTSVYTSYSFTQVRLALQYLSNGIVESTWSGTNFASFMGSGRNSSNSRATWTSWVDTAFNTSGSGWLSNCNQFGTNKAYNYQYIRIGGTVNGENDCNTNDESFGFGSRGISPYTNNLSCGAFSPYGKPSGRKKGWIFVK